MVKNSGHSIPLGGSMRPMDMYRYIGFRPKRQNCSEKKQYSSREDAAKAAREYNQRIVFGDMGEYRCDLHQAWHVGHRDKHRVANEMLLVCILWFKAQKAETERRKQGSR